MRPLLRALCSIPALVPALFGACVFAPAAAPCRTDANCPADAQRCVDGACTAVDADTGQGRDDAGAPGRDDAGSGADAGDDDEDAGGPGADAGRPDAGQALDAGDDDDDAGAAAPDAGVADAGFPDGDNDAGRDGDGDAGCRVIEGNISVDGEGGGLDVLHDGDGCVVVTGSIDISGSTLSTLEALSNVVSIGGDLVINENGNLHDLTDLSGLDFLGGDLIVNGNPDLPTCAVAELYESIENVEGSASWMGNLEGECADRPPPDAGG